jgi:hypothetical protein
VSDSTEHTTVKLARALRAIPGVPEDMIKRAEDGYYHDYLSPLVLPDVQLYTDLKELSVRPELSGLSRIQVTDLARRVVDGEFDASKAEAEEWMRSPEGQQAFQQVFKRGPAE